MSDTAQFDRAPTSGAPNPLSAMDRNGLPLGAKDIGAKDRFFVPVEERALFWLSLAIGICCLALVVIRPDARAAWLFAGILVPLSGLLVRFLPGLAEAPPQLRSGLGRTLLLTGFLVLIALALRLAEALNWLSIDVVRRLIGMAVGGVLVLVGLKLPHRLLPHALVRFELPVAVRLVGLCGTTAVFGGAAYAFLWLAAPLDQASLWGSAVLGALALLLGLRSTLLVHRAGAPGSARGADEVGQRRRGDPAQRLPDSTQTQNTQNASCASDKGD